MKTARFLSGDIDSARPPRTAAASAPAASAGRIACERRTNRPAESHFHRFPFKLNRTSEPERSISLNGSFFAS